MRSMHRLWPQGRYAAASRAGAVPTSAFCRFPRTCSTRRAIKVRDPTMDQIIASILNLILTEHLPYALDTFEQSFVFLHSTEYADLRRRLFLKNAAIEVF